MSPKGPNAAQLIRAIGCAAALVRERCVLALRLGAMDATHLAQANVGARGRVPRNWRAPRGVRRRGWRTHGACVRRAGAARPLRRQPPLPAGGVRDALAADERPRRGAVCAGRGVAWRKGRDWCAFKTFLACMDTRFRVHGYVLKVHG